MASVVRKAEIVRWANDNLSARSELPALVRGLIHATVHEIEKIDFPAYESVGRSGFDGDLLCSRGNAWVPAGQSRWELSVRKKVGAKATDDYEKRTTKTPKEIRETSTLVVLTAQHWENKATWQSEIEQRGEWKALKTYDADDLEQWIELSPAVEAWFCERLNLPVGEFADHTRSWNALSASTRLPLLAETFLVSRKRSHERFRKWLAESASYLGVVAPFPEDVTDFACSAIESMQDSVKEVVCSRLIYVETRRAFRQLLRRGGILSAIVGPQVQLSQADIAEAIERGVRVVHALPPYDPLPDSVIRLERVSEHELARTLEKCGLPTVVAEQKAHDCGGITTLLKKSLARFATPTDTTIILESERSTLRACLLLGGWNGKNAADRAAVERLAGKSYDDVEVDCNKWSRQRNPMLFSAGGKWRLVSKGDAWHRMSSQLPSSAFEMAAPVVVEVLTDTDPAFDLPDTERWLARVKGFSPSYSATIKRHLSETLAFLGTFGEFVAISGTAGPAEYSRRVLSEVVSDAASSKRWASLGSLLSLVAEASPETYLAAIEADLASCDPKLAELFSVRNGHPLVSGCDYTGLLWSLETLAWSPKFLLRVCRILLKLHHFYTPSNYSNCPMGSLAQILSCAIPFTTATVDQRIAVVDRLLAEDEEHAWSLLMSLLDQLGGGGSPMTSRPDWRDWASEWEIGATYADFDRQLDAMSAAVLKHVGARVERWCDLFGILTTMPRERIDQTLIAVAALIDRQFLDQDRKGLCTRIDEFVSLHRHHLATSKKLTAEDLDALAEVAKALQPSSLAMRHAWLFEHWVNRHYMRNADIKDAEQELRADRLKAIQEVLAVDGLDGVFELAQHSSLPFAVGTLLSEITGDVYTHTIIPGRITTEDWSLNLVLGFASHRHETAGANWINEQLPRCENASQRAWLLAMLPFVNSTWDLVDVQRDMEVKSLYWSRVRHWGAERDPSSIGRCSSELIATGRIAHAADVVCAALHDNASLSVDVLLAPLEAILAAKPELAVGQLKEMKDYEVGMLLTAAQKAEDPPEDRLFALEVNFLRMLGDDHQGSPVTLFKRLASDPEFFVELLSLVFKSTNVDQNPVEKLSDQEVSSRKALAHSAYDLLHKWNQIPGTGKEGTIDSEVLRDWIEHTLKVATDRGYEDVCYAQIGQLLANSPAEADGSWPCAAVREVVEEIATERLGSGIYFGVLNSRGVVCRGEGGEQERELAEKYRRLAEQIRVEAPFIATILDNLCQSYLSDAKRWDATEDWER